MSPSYETAPVTRQDREHLQGHAARTVWLTGLFDAGKTTLVQALETSLHHDGLRTDVLDGDQLRSGLCSGLGFSDGQEQHLSPVWSCMTPA